MYKNYVQSFHQDSACMYDQEGGTAQRHTNYSRMI